MRSETKTTCVAPSSAARARTSDRAQSSCMSCDTRDPPTPKPWTSPSDRQSPVRTSVIQTGALLATSLRQAAARTIAARAIVERGAADTSLLPNALYRATVGGSHLYDPQFALFR